MMHLVCFPKIDVACGFPPVVKLTEREAKAMARIHCGGVEALRTADYKATCRTIDSLVKKNLLAGDGPTLLGTRVAKSLADSGVF